ncbi:alpha/beta hydrolase family protein [Streptomyces peucetius]|uniref:Alpha/beta hydrolase n=1 Tax=Streptomyces peucetius TaxID=1950 RepID=A0ABY6I705_STRPE|nr:alpha/beta family hydrolase [Streptomyces peucetius]UYQ61510.1 alpha/beta hydrolase [Streptomyces peucetius]
MAVLIRRGAKDTGTPAGPALRLDRFVTPSEAAVLLLHGGRADALEPPSALNLPGVRMRPFVRSVARATTGHGIALGRVRYAFRGWNGSRADAGRDALRALDELAAVTGPVPTVLVGHSMGGRAALHAAGHPLVSAVVGLAPWCPGGEPVDHLTGKRLVLLHGERDRVTDPRETWAFADRARAAGAEVHALSMPGGDHAMLRGAADWHTLTTGMVTGLLGLGPFPARGEHGFRPVPA